ncbi:hypothetical protein DPX16_6706 [Anabarilius grahami]|uniref:Reverse transcriptase domain-containing protein n=1 Tax=Anabarilius grahami TaxID=495550 RepID=A0A3N0YFC1_ANAGA|nr:hypothetical protein DPX16_6706 [Anabarilius grahami]
MKKSTDHVGVGIPWTDHYHLANLDFENDVALLAEDDPQLQVATTRLSQEAAKTGLRVNTEKLKSMPVGLVGPIGNGDTEVDTRSRIANPNPNPNFGYKTIILSTVQLPTMPAEPRPCRLVFGIRGSGLSSFRRCCQHCDLCCLLTFSQDALMPCIQASSASTSDTQTCTASLSPSSPTIILPYPLLLFS